MTIIGTPTNLNLNGTTPPPPPGAVNVGTQAGLPYPDPNDPTQVVRDESDFYYPVPVGGSFVISADYQLSDVDSGYTIIANSAIPITVTMPPTAPTLQVGQGRWNVSIRNFGAGLVTVVPNGPNLEGSSANVKLVQGAALLGVSTDGTDYYGIYVPAKVLIAIPSTTRGDFSLVHGLGATPKDAAIKATSTGLIRFQASPSPPWDATNIYLNASADGLTGFLGVSV
jgi:hypothetical protein